MSKLTGKVAVVTGASKGIGAAIAKSLAAEGASVVVNYASSKAARTLWSLQSPQPAARRSPCGGDVSKAAEAQGIIDAAIKNFGRLDILVNNSGVYEFCPDRSYHRRAVPPDVQHQRARPAADHAGGRQAPRRRRQHHQYRLGRQPDQPRQRGLHRHQGRGGRHHRRARQELGARKIRVNSINPGIVETEGTHTAGFIGSDFEKATIAQTPLGRTGQPGDIASIAVFLASDDSGWLTGEQHSRQRRRSAKHFPSRWLKRRTCTLRGVPPKNRDPRQASLRGEVRLD